MLEHIENINIIQIGVGGTGSYLISPTIKFLNNLRDRFIVNNLKCRYYLFDDDTVEPQNIIRQNFNKYDIGKFKSDAKLLQHCHETDFLYSIKYRIKKNDLNKIFNYKKINQLKIFYNINHISYINSINLIIGCSDNNETRLNIFNDIKNISKKKQFDDFKIIYLDSGNSLTSGQIITTYFNNKNAKIKFKNENSFNNIKNFKEKFLNNNDENNLSCEFFGDQSQSINLMAATLLFINIQKILIENMLPPNIIEFNNSGWSSFKI